MPLKIFPPIADGVQKDFMEQQLHGFSDSTPRAGSDIEIIKIGKSLLSAIQLISNSQISPQKCVSGHFDPF